MELDFERLEQDPGPYVAEVCALNLMNIDETLERHPALYAYAVAGYEGARIDEARAKFTMERARSQAFGELVKENAIGTAKELVPNDPAVQRATEAWLEAKRMVAGLRALTAGLEHRRDMLIQISSRQKREQQAY